MVRVVVVRYGETMGQVKVSARGVLVLLSMVLLVSVALAQPRAWRDINFGDSLLDVADKLVQYDDVFDGHMPLPRRVESTSTTPELILRYASTTTSIGGHRYTLRFSFYDGRLYRLAFVGKSYDASFFDTHVADSHRTLVQTISTTARSAAITP